MSESNMAGAKAKTKNSLETFSRFSVLGIESEEEEEKASTEKTSNAEKNAKKRARKKKKASAQNTNELRNMATNPVSKAAIQSIHQKNHPMPVENNRSSTHKPEHYVGTSNMNSVHDSNARNVATESIDRNYEHRWEEWKSKDESYVVDQFQRDLEAALRISAAQDVNLSKKQEGSKSGKKKNQKKATMSLEEFSQLTTESASREQAPSVNKQPILNGYCPEELDPNHFEYQYEQPVLDEAPTRHSTENKKSRKKKKMATENKTTLSDLSGMDEKATHSITVVQQEHSMMDATSLAAFQNEVDEKNKEVLRLQRSNVKLVEELAQVKKRNKQLCFILAQGEMKEKSEILLQVDELNNIKNELSTQLEGMYSALEQERTKVTILKQELQKYQGSRSKSISEEM